MSAKYSLLANRYAKAVLATCKEVTLAKNVAIELEEFFLVLTNNKELSFVLTGEAINASKRAEVLSDVLKKTSFQEITKNTLAVLTESGRMSQLSLVVEKLKQHILFSKDMVPVEVVCSANLNDEQKTKLEKRISELLKKKIEVDYQVDSSLIGGVRIKAVGRTYDGTLSGWLSACHEQLNQGITSLA